MSIWIHIVSTWTSTIISSCFLQQSAKRVLYPWAEPDYYIATNMNEEFISSPQNLQYLPFCLFVSTLL